VACVQWAAVVGDPLSLLARLEGNRVRFAGEFEDVRLVSQAIQQSQGQTLIAKELGPVSKFEIGGNHSTFAEIGQ
jgi:hypothetical protein